MKRVCECGCGSILPAPKRKDRVSRFRRGHNARQDIESRFWSKVQKTESCWLWTAGLNATGYGIFRLPDKCVFAHRLSYELTNGPFPKHLSICHSCDTPACVNPAHLKPETQKYNAQDRERKGRGNHYGCKRPGQNRGEKNPNAKITRQDAEEIRRIYAIGGITQTKLGNQFGVSNQTVSLIIHNLIWPS